MGCRTELDWNRFTYEEPETAELVREIERERANLWQEQLGILLCAEY